MGEPHEGMAARDLIAVLERWRNSGAVWQVLSRSSSRVTVALRRCDGGEEVERLTSEDPELLAFLGDRVSSQD